MTILSGSATFLSGSATFHFTLGRLDAGFGNDEELTRPAHRAGA
jgi:hypothetical protein